MQSKSFSTILVALAVFAMWRSAKEPIDEVLPSSAMIGGPAQALFFSAAKKCNPSRLRNGCAFA
jgi:hypothetical protein